MANILIVDDSPTQAAKLDHYLTHHGHNPAIAVDAEMALDLLNDTAFDLVISDIVMPGISGYQLCHRIKNTERWKNIPVILLTTLKDPMDIIQGLESGADNFFTKPYEPEQLIRRVNSMLEGRRLVAEGKLRVGFEVSFLGRQFAINSDRQQILDLLISTFEQIVEANHELERRGEELTAARAQIEEYARRLEEKVEVTEARYQAILKNVGDAIITSDRDGRILTMNRAAEHLFQYSAPEVVGLSLDKLVEISEGVPVSTSTKRYFNGAPSLFVGKGAREITSRKKDGSSFPFEVVVTDVSYGSDQMLCVSGRDITERKQLESDLRQAQKMDAIGQLTGGIAHDFNNLLMVVIGNLELLEESVEKGSEDEESTHSALSAAQRGADLTRRLLAFARRQVLEPEVRNVNDLIGGLEDLLKRTLGTNVDLKTNLTNDIGLAKIDPEQLELAILNLAVNARDAMQDGGALTIESGKDYLDANYAARHMDVAEGDYVMIAVSDTGCGMPPHVIERAFEPFFTTKQEGRGTGLGLSMVYGFIKQSGGHIRIYSEVGHGTTIKLYLPAEKQQEETSAANGTVAQTVETASGETILLVEDDPNVQDVGAKILDRLGYNVIRADTGADALGILTSNRKIDLLFTDIMMKGGMSGTDLAKRAREKWPTQKVLFCSGFTETAFSRNEPLEPGTFFISKPYSRANLAAMIRKILDK